MGSLLIAMAFSRLSSLIDFRRRPFARQVGGMVMLTAFGQGLYVLAGPLIGRIFSPDQLGYYGLFFTLWVVGGGAVCFMYDYAIAVVHDDGDARDLTWLCLILGGGVSLLAGSGLAASAAGQWFGLGMFPIWAGPLFSLALLIGIVNQLAQNWRVRHNDVLKIGRSNVTLNALRGLSQVLLGLLSPVWYMLIAGEIVGRVIGTAQLVSGSRSKNAVLFPGGRRLLQAMRKHKTFPVIFGPAFILDASAMLLQLWALGVLYGPVTMGQYFLMRRTLDMPVAFAVKSLTDLFHARQIVEAREAPERLRSSYVRASASLAAGGFAAGLPVFLFGEQLFRFFYGANWGLAGTLASIMVPAMVLNLAVAPVSRIFLLSPRPYLRLIPGVAINVLTVAAIVLALRQSLPITQTVALFSVAIGTQYLFYFAAGYFAAGRMLPGEVQKA